MTAALQEIVDFAKRKPYQNKGRHVCAVIKKPCLLSMKSEHSLSSENRIFCENCNRYCHNQEWFDEHEYGVCYIAYKCKKCSKVCLQENNHMCGYRLCKNCGQIVHYTTHKCYLQVKPAKGGRCEKGCKKCTKCLIEIHPNLETLVKNKYRKLILKHRPDKGGDKYEFQKIYDTFKRVQNVIRLPMTSETFHTKFADDFNVLGVRCSCKEVSNPDCTYSEKYI